ncbi:MAG: T9SS type A sorting domain-containing protein [Chitinophagaceae bacterium]
MKNKRLFKKSRQNYLFTGIAGIVLSSSHSFDNTDVFRNQRTIERKSVNEGSGFKKDKKNLIKITHNPDNNSVRIMVKDLAGETLDFYVFDLEGTMVVNYKLKSREKKIITTLEKGSYTYNAFAGDEETDFGKIVIE